MSAKNIVNGPSKLDLLASVFIEGARGHHNDPLAFTLKSGRVLMVFVYGAKREDGTYESWNLTGRCKETSDAFNAHYRTDTRKGTTLPDG